VVNKIFQGDLASNLYVKDNYAFVSEMEGLSVIDISNLEELEVVGSFDTNGFAYGIFVQEDLAYVADWDNGLVVVNVSNPYNPQEVGFYPFGIEDIYVKGNNLYLAGYEGFIIVDVSDSSNPIEIGRYEEIGWLKGVYVDGDNAYVVNKENKLIVLNITEESTPLIKELDLDPEIEGSVEDVFVKDNYAYVSCGYDGVVIVDVSTPSNPSIIKSYTAEGLALAGIYIDENYVYAATLWNGLKIIEGFDVNNLENAQIVGEFSTRRWAWDVWVEGEYAYIADDDNGLVIVDVSTPGSPVLVADMPWKAFNGVSGN
jgi:hypothetical protein